MYLISNPLAWDTHSEEVSCPFLYQTFSDHSPWKLTNLKNPHSATQAQRYHWKTEKCWSSEQFSQNPVVCYCWFPPQFHALKLLSKRCLAASLCALRPRFAGLHLAMLCLCVSSPELVAAHELEKTQLKENFEKLRLSLQVSASVISHPAVLLQSTPGPWILPAVFCGAHWEGTAPLCPYPSLQHRNLCARDTSSSLKASSAPPVQSEMSSQGVPWAFLTLLADSKYVASGREKQANLQGGKCS